MSTFTYSALFLLLPFFLTITTLANRLGGTIPPPTSFPSIPQHPNSINILLLDIINDLPKDALSLYIVGSFQATEYEIEPGDEYARVLKYTDQECEFLYGGSNPGPIKSASLIVFDPNGADKGHIKVFWSVRMDGLYKSWDKINWVKKADWGPPPAKTVRMIDEP
ncbi:hypothetical protein L6164_013146 [Bauhinia variegata]|uniref:Uncharacterized protein n=1 Tax=Bauhinia variegata TaxID=167791 RepID=A0ACB9PB62_BAUVA|nr:hypothetical protein L6164_013146 [Bauhinia variegata]